MISNDELEEMWTRAKSATPGPWFVHYTDDAHAAMRGTLQANPDLKLTTNGKAWR